LLERVETLLPPASRPVDGWRHRLSAGARPRATLYPACANLHRIGFRTSTASTARALIEQNTRQFVEGAPPTTHS